MTEPQPWHGVNLATTLPINADFSVNYDGYAQHVQFVTSHGVTGIIPNGSLGEYQTLTEEERKQVFLTAVDAAPAGTAVIPGVGAYGALESVRLTEHAAANGAPAVMLLPPNAYRASDAEVIEHFRRVAAVGLPVLAYNNPIDTKVDLQPELLAHLFEEGLIVAVKEFSGDVRNALRDPRACSGLDVSIGSDDVVFELGINGAIGWVAGYPNAIPRGDRRAVQPVHLGRPAEVGAGAGDLPRSAPAAALGLEDLVRSGHQALAGSRRCHAGRRDDPPAASASARRHPRAVSSPTPRPFWPRATADPERPTMQSTARLPRRRFAHRGHAHAG